LNFTYLEGDYNLDTAPSFISDIFYKLFQYHPTNDTMLLHIIWVFLRLNIKG